MAQDLKKRILLVDDEKEVLTFLSSILERYGYEVACTDKGKDALRLAREFEPHVIILDIVMPDLDGAGVAAALDNDSHTKNIPVIFLSGIVGKTEEELGIKAGKKYKLVAKPVDEAELLGVIKRAVYR